MPRSSLIVAESGRKVTTQSRGCRRSEYLESQAGHRQHLGEASSAARSATGRLRERKRQHSRYL